MIDFEGARKEAFKEFKQTNKTRVLNKYEVIKLDLKKFVEVWEVKTEVLNCDNEAVNIKLHICFPSDFPLTTPKVHLSREDYDWIKYIPHLDFERNVCLFDTETIKVDPHQPYGIVKESVRQAKRIIESGLKKENTSDYEQEFIAYWEDRYTVKDKIISCLTLIPQEYEIHERYLPLVSVPGSVKGYHFIIHTGDEPANNFLKYLGVQPDSDNSGEALYLGEIAGASPPFYFDNLGAVRFVEKHFSSLILEVQKFIDSKKQKIIIFSKLINGRRIFFGWVHDVIDIRQKGFRPNALKPWKVLTTLQSKTPVARLSFHEFTDQRLKLRTDGVDSINQRLKLTIVGLGSIGSNLLHYLKVLPVGLLNLIDPEVLTLENINRHLLGFSAIGSYKADALQKYLQQDNPLLNVRSFPTSVLNIFNNNINVLKEVDFVFVVVGKDNIEEYIIDALREGLLTTPVFILWVEPYLLGGHVLLVNPGTQLFLKDLYVNGHYKYNVISNKEYVKPENRLLLREAGCQSSYVPYGMVSVISFLSSIAPLVYKLLSSEIKEDVAITWVNDLNIADDLKFQVSDYIIASPHRDSQFIINNLNEN